MIKDDTKDPVKDPVPAPQNRAFVITGMHRSGTSALAGLLHQAQLPMGGHLVPAVEGINDKGFFEDKRILALNESLFTLFDRTWYDVDNIEAALWLQPAVEKLKEQARTLIEDEFMPLGAWVVKDPRFCLLLPFWIPVFESLNIEVTYLICIRPSDEVAQSLAVRDDFELSQGKLLWLQHYVAIEQATRDQHRMFVSFGRLVRAYDAELLRLMEVVDSRRINFDFIDSSLKHHSDTGETVEKNLSVNDKICASLFEAMQTYDEENIRTVFDTRGEEFRDQEQLFKGVLRSQRMKIIDLQNSFESAEEIVTNQKDQFDFQQLGLQQAVDMVKARDQLLQQKDLEIVRLGALIKNTQAAPVVPLVVDSQPKYESTIDLAAMNNAHTKVIRQVLKLSKNFPILEVGCSTAYLGSYLKAQGYSVWGIEPDAEAAAVAKTRLDYVFEGDVESFFAAANDLEFGAILFGDVLEHLIDPAEVLKQARGLLTDVGLVVASIPNVAHMSVRMMLLEGRWEYQDTGIMDNTHLRFFTRDSIIDLMSESAFKILNMDAVELPWQVSGPGINTELFDKAMPLISDSESDVFQYVVTSTPMVNPESTNDSYKVKLRKKVLCLLPLPDSALASIRILEPLAKHTEKYGSDVRVSAAFAPKPEDIAWCDLVVFQREANPHVLALISELRGLGKQIVFDIDDLLLDVPEYLSVYEHCKRMRPMLENVMRLVDIVTVSTAPLFDEVVGLNPNTKLVPNGAFTPYQPIEHYDTGQEVLNLIVASSDTVRVDFIVDALRALVEKYQNRINLIGIGPPGEYLRDRGLPIAVHPLMTHERFRAFLASQSNTMAWIPLDDSRFNRCKSAVKFFDYALAGVPVLCSNMTPYADVIDHGFNAYLCSDDINDWVDNSCLLINSAALRQTMSRQAHKRAYEYHSIERTASAWQETFESLQNIEPRPVVAAIDASLRRPTPMVSGILRRITKPSAYVGALRVYRLYGLRGMWNFLTSVA